MRNRIIILFILSISLCFNDVLANESNKEDTLHVWRSNQPVVIGRRNNIVLDLSCEGKKINSISISLKEARGKVDKIELYYTGTTSMLFSRTTSSALISHQSIYGGGQKIYSNPSYSVLKTSVDYSSKKDGDNVTLNADMNLYQGGRNYFYISVAANAAVPLSESFDIHITGAKIDGKDVIIREDGENLPVRFAVSVKDAGDEGIFAYRIPGIVTAGDGTLVSAYDIRRNSSIDLQEDIQIGVSRSRDGGRTWSKNILAMDMRGTNSLPDCQNGTGDPSILIDPETGRIYIMALWTHGIGASTSWQHCKRGFNPEDGAAQVLLIESSDNGKTWSKPLNITRQIKDSLWFILLQGPGRGIAMKDGTLVFPFQYKDENDFPAATIVYSKDKGKTWTIGSRARENTTESQVVEMKDGSLMLNMRDNRGGSRAVSITKDMGRTWYEHSSSRSLLREPVCMASLIRVEAKDNCLGKDILFFSNPDTTTKRNHITIKASLDEGITWNEGLLIDAENGWGYSCLTMIDTETIGILYESSKSHLLFQAVKIKDIIK